MARKANNDQTVVELIELNKRLLRDTVELLDRVNKLLDEVEALIADEDGDGEDWKSEDS